MYLTQSELFERRSYPAGEGHSILKLDGVGRFENLVIEAHVRNFNDLCTVRVQNDILRRAGARARWFLPYFPYARQDRRETQKSGFELAMAMNLTIGVDVVIADPHSDVAGTIPHFTQTSVYNCMADRASKLCFDLDAMTVVIPDAGAAKKAYGWATGGGRPIIQGLKKRDPSTGKLSGFEVIAEMDGGCCPDLYGKDVLILDDICDGGGTFLGLGEILLRKYQAKSLTLAVTHGLFTQGLENLERVFDRIISFVPSGTAHLAANKKFFAIDFETLYTNYEGEIL